MTDFLLLDGALLRAVDPVLLRATTFGHFTSLQVRDGPPVPPATEAVRLRSYEHERSVPHLKHTGTFDLTYYARKAKREGYDDAVFHTAAGEISEASIWNICFARGTELVFPSAPVLPGIRQQLLQRGLPTHTTAPVPLTDLNTYDAAYLTNSIDPALPVASIDETTYEPHPESAKVIAQAYASQPAQPV